MKHHRNKLMIPGPVEFSPAVLNAMAQPTESHVGANFVNTFKKALEQLKTVFCANSYQGFILAGSGTFAMDVAASNVLEQNDQVLIIDTGYFSQRMVQLIKHYGLNPDVLTAKLGTVPSLDLIKETLAKKDYKAVFLTHVDTSTGVLFDLKLIAQQLQGKDTLLIVDGVAAAAAAECKTEEWGIDIYFSASQKACGTPPGLALLMVSPRALALAEQRKKPLPNYYASWQNWLPVMKAYAQGDPAYFGTPPVNLIYALVESFTEIIAEGMEIRIKRHLKQAFAFRQGLKALGLQTIPQTDSVAAPTLSAIYYPSGIGSELIKSLAENGVVAAGGILPKFQDQYFRLGHMGCCNYLDLIAVLAALEQALYSLDYCCFDLGSAVAAFQNAYIKKNFLE